MLRIISLLILVLTAALPAGADDAPATGFIYGTVLTHDDEAHTGFLRWDQEEAFWDDLFHSLRKDYPWYEYVDKDELTEERRHAYYRKHGLLDRLVWALFGRDEKIETSRIFICRFGDIRRLTVTGDYAADVETRDGTTHNVAGYSNDVGGTVFVLSTDGHGDRIELDWDEIDTIDFKNTPPWAEASALRLFGTVETEDQTFEGFIQWDKSECTTTDKLDGKADGRDEDIAMGDIVTIERHGSRSADVELKNGQTLRMSGTNDVNSDNRGIMIETPDQGRITVPWKKFRRLSLERGLGSGSAIDDFPTRRALSGTVIDADGTHWRGRIVFDLDEAYTWDIFNGTVDDLEYDIPFALIASVERADKEHSWVTLRSGQRLRLGDSPDAGRGNDGLLIFSHDGAEPDYIPWRLVDRVEFRD